MNGVKFDGVDLFLSLPHTDIDSSDDDLKRLADNWPPKTAGGVAGRAGVAADRWRFGDGQCGGAEEFPDAGEEIVPHRREAARDGHSQIWRRPHRFRDRARRSGHKDAEANTKRIAETFREAGNIAEGFGERLAAEGEICWGGMHSWRRNVELLEMVGRPQTLGFQADMAHTMLFTMGYNAPEDRLLPEDFDWSESEELAAAYKTMASALRPWTFDFHVAQNDGTVKGAGSHDKTGQALPADGPERQARCGARCGRLDARRQWACARARSSISAGMAACSPTR